MPAGLAKIAALCACLVLAPGQPGFADAAESGPAALLDPISGLVMDEGWELVRGHCSACHSPRLVTQNRGSRATWLSMIRWMQDSQGLWEFEAATEAAILDYLARNYGPVASSRRAPVAPELLPANPYTRKDSS